MNKKFTFMVAALLAAGGFSANAAVTGNDITKAANGKCFHVVIDASDTSLGQDDYVLGSSVDQASGDITYDVSQKITSSTELPDLGENVDNYTWKVVVAERGGKTEVTLVNVATGYALAVNKDAETDGTLVSNTQEYTNGSELDNTFELATGSTLKYAESKFLAVATEALSVGETSGAKVYLVEVADQDVEAEELKNIGTGISINLDGTIDGEDIFNSVSVVTLTDVTSGDKQFLLQVGSTTTTTYANMTSDEFKKAEFIVLTQKEVEGADAGAETGTGYTYAKVKGEKLVKAAELSTLTAVTEGVYPVQNAVFTAVKNANKEGKYAFKHASLMLPNASNEWELLTSPVIYIGYDDCGVAGTATLTSAATATWATVSGGTAVEVKNLVKGQWVVNILTSDDKESTVMKRVVYAKQDASSGVMVSGTADDTENNKDEVYAQWIVSANNDNTVTFINREAAGVKIQNVTLFKTPKDNVYSVSSATVASSSTTETAFNNLNQCYIELRTVENTTQFDGYLKLEEEDVNSTEFTLGVDAGNKFEEIELPVVLASDNASLTAAEDKDAENAFTFKLVQATTKEGETTKLDTVVVNPISYSYYKDGKLVEAKDTLKAISYVMTGLKNAGKQGSDANEVMKANFSLDKKDAEAGEFIFRKVGDRYQIADGAGYAAATFVEESSNKYQIAASTTSAITDAVAFSLNAIPVAPSYDVPESHIALQINGAYLGSKADGNAIMTNDTSMLKSTVADAAFSFYAFSADKEEAKTPSYYLSSNGMMMYSPANEIAAINKEISELSPVFDAEEIAELEAKRDAYMVNGENLVKFQRAKYEAADKVALADTTYTKDADLKPFKFNVLDVDGQAVLKNAASGYVKAINDVVVFTSSIDNAAKFDVVAAEAPTSNEGVSATEVKVVANNGSVVVKNAAGKNVVVSTILGQVVANEVLTSDNATINVPAGIVVVAVEGESFKVNVK